MPTALRSKKMTLSWANKVRGGRVAPRGDNLRRDSHHENELEDFYTVDSPEDGQWGVPLPNGDWSGMVGMVYNNKSDLALGPLVMTYGRSQVITFSSQVTTNYLTILAGFPNVIHGSIFGTLMAFNLELCVLTAVMLEVFKKKKGGPSVQDMLSANWWMYFFMLFCEASPRPPRGTPSRIVFAMWWLTVLVLMNAFTGHMKATMMVRTEPDRIESMKELAERGNMKTFIWEGTAYESLLRDSRNVPEYQAVWEMVLRCNGMFDNKLLYSRANLIAVQNGDAVIVRDASTMRFHVAARCGLLTQGSFSFSQEQFFPHKYAVALNRTEDPAFVAIVNQRISWMKESGLLDAWMEEEYGDWQKCASGSGEDTYRPLSMFDMQFIFFIYFMFSAASAIGFLSELLVGA
ncbi:glutamate receptor ionotropic, kainate glr-3-like [Dermacentor andersoni]|uniref:glutamate receptor ionotropic, kainate glr-3-like n=1 Tax=Dermacentor andersoni TaxID=34620 RepID=UPI003B3BBE93